MCFKNIAMKKKKKFARLPLIKNKISSLSAINGGNSYADKKTREPGCVTNPIICFPGSLDTSCDTQISCIPVCTRP